MTIDPSLLVELLLGLGALGAFAWGVWRFVDGKLERQRADYETKIAVLRADHEAQLRDLAGKVAECVRREEIKGLGESISRVHGRLDDIWKFLAGELAAKLTIAKD